MSDTALNRFIQFGTTAERLAFTPNPPVGSRISYFFFDTTLSSMYAWNGSAFVLVTAATGGITALTGDVTASGTGSVAATIAANAVVTAKILNANVTYAKIQNVGATKLVGNSTGGATVASEVGVASGIEFNSTNIRQTVAARTRQIGITIDGGGSIVTAGAKGFKSFPVAGTITGVRLIADQSGSVAFDIKKSTYAAFPTQATIVAAAPPTITTAQKSEDTTLTGWTTSVAAGDILGFEITGSPASITRVTLELTIVVTG